MIAGVAHLLRLAQGGCQSQPMANQQTCAGVDGKFSGARFSFLGSQRARSRHRAADRAPTWIKNIDGVRVGFIGAVTRSTPGIVVPSGVAGVRFVGEAKAINHYAKELAGARRAGDRCRRARGRRRGWRLRRVPKSARSDIRYRSRARPGDRYRAFCAYASRLQLCHRWPGHHSGGFLRKARSRSSTLKSTALPERSFASAHARAIFRCQMECVPATHCALPIHRSRPTRRSRAIVEHYLRLAAPLAQRPIGSIVADFDRRASAGGDSALGRLVADAQLAATRDARRADRIHQPGRACVRICAHPAALAL